MSNKKILIVEDDKNISKLVKYNLEKSGFECEISITGEDALLKIYEDNFDLILLDIMLPKMDGLELCKEIKQDKKLSNIAIIMLTAKGEEIDRIVGLELGVDDYVVKPFSPRELILRIKAVLRRKEDKHLIEEVLKIDSIVMDIARHKVIVDKKDVKLASMEFKLLKTLLSRKGRVQSRDLLLDEVWGLSADVTTRTVDTHIKLLRQKLGEKGSLIETVRGIGYKINVS